MKVDTVFKILLVVVISFTIRQLLPFLEITKYPDYNYIHIIIKHVTTTFRNFNFFHMKKELLQFYKEQDILPKPFFFCFFGFSAIITLLVKVILHKISLPIAERLIPQKKWSKRIREIKVRRFNLMFFNLFYFSLISAFGYITLRDKNYFPVELGGKGNQDEYFTDYPNQKTSSRIHLYYFMNGGYLLTSVYSFLVAEKLPDFYENLLQHLCAMILVYFSYAQNFLRVGAIIMLCHDVCELLSSACRVFVDTSYKFVTVSCFCILFVSWGYLRLYVFAKRCILVIHRNVDLISSFLKFETAAWLTFLLSVMLLMNTYWFVLMGKMFIHFLSSGQAEDILTRVDELEDSSTTTNVTTTNQTLHKNKQKIKVRKNI